MSTLFNNKKKYDFIELCKMTQVGLKNYVSKELEKYYEDFVIGDGYIYAVGDIPVLVTAHMDTVHKEIVKKVVFTGKGDKLQVSSPQGIGGDDRCGVWMILEVLRKGLRPYVLFCEDEEIGGHGSDKFVKSSFCKELENLKYFIELDRANKNDAVYYDCGNEEFKKFIKNNTGYKEAWGSFSDISNLSPATDVASVNLSCGYYKAHTKEEYVVISEMNNTLDKVIELLKLDYSEIGQFDFQEEFYYRRGFSTYGSGYSYNRYGGTYKGYEMYTFLYKENDELEIYETYAESVYEALGDFMLNNPDVCYNDIQALMDEDGLEMAI